MPNQTPHSDRPLLLVTAPFDPARAELLQDVFDVELVEPSLSGTSLATQGIDEQLARATALVCEVDVVDEATLDKSPELRVVVSCRANPVNVDVEACTARGIAVLTTPARNADVTADLAFTLLLMTVRHTGRAERWLRSGAWKSEDVFEPYSIFRGIGLSGRTLGILGGGAIGRRMMQRARAFGMDVVVYDPFLPADAFGDQARVVELDEVLSTADIVTVHVPLAESTIGLIGDRELRLMRPDAYLVNAGRAAVVEEDALVNALTEGRIAGAGLDVFWTEPVPADHPLLGLDNVTVTPHIGGASDDVVTEHSKIAERGLRAWTAGERPAAIANPAVLESTTAR
ncbi:NAD(P)-dependent oxidoreductase [Streptomyces sp. NPDC087512]|uniref:NAD(P)-dependent oxidoreductase n=1 Tax=Streptomyces sp. NPDC087512 TaxID=3155059 RepID=UPI00343CFDAB